MRFSREVGGVRRGGREASLDRQRSARVRLPHLQQMVPVGEDEGEGVRTCPTGTRAGGIRGCFSDSGPIDRGGSVGDRGSGGSIAAASGTPSRIPLSPDAEVLRDPSRAAPGDVREIPLLHVRQRRRVEPGGRGGLHRGGHRRIVRVRVAELGAQQRIVVLLQATPEGVLLDLTHDR